MLLAGNPMIGTSKVADMMDSKAIGKRTEVIIIEVKQVIKGVFFGCQGGRTYS